jgi:hypothetical protein
VHAVTAPPGWYRDPDDSTGERWWDGAAWSSRTRLRTLLPAADVAERRSPLQQLRAGATVLVPKSRSGLVRSFRWIWPVLAVAAVRTAASAFIWLTGPSPDGAAANPFVAFVRDSDLFWPTVVYVASVSCWRARHLCPTRPRDRAVVYAAAVVAAVPVAFVLARVATVFVTVAAAFALVAVALRLSGAAAPTKPNRTRPGRTTRKRAPASHYRSDARAKVEYLTRRAAEQAAREFERDRREAMNSYRCSQCRRWHIGHAD